MGQRYGLEIRAAGGADAAGLAELLGQAGRPAPAAEVAAALDALQRAGGTALLALEWGPPSGLALLQVCRGLGRPSGLITALLVGPDARRRGVGRLLLKATARAARQAGCDRLLLGPEGMGQGAGEGAGEGAAALRAFAAATGFAPAGDLVARPLLRRGSAEG